MTNQQAAHRESIRSARVRVERSHIDHGCCVVRYSVCSCFWLPRLELPIVSYFLCRNLAGFRKCPAESEDKTFFTRRMLWEHAGGGCIGGRGSRASHHGRGRCFRSFCFVFGKPLVFFFFFFLMRVDYLGGHKKNVQQVSPLKDERCLSPIDPAAWKVS